jgi:hypothetical protein
MSLFDFISSSPETFISIRTVGAHRLCAPTHHETPFIPNRIVGAYSRSFACLQATPLRKIATSFTPNHTVGARGPSPLHKIETPFVANDTTKISHEMFLRELNNNAICDYSNVWNSL